MIPGSQIVRPRSGKRFNQQSLGSILSFIKGTANIDKNATVALKSGRELQSPPDICQPWNPDIAGGISAWI